MGMVTEPSLLRVEDLTCFAFGKLSAQLTVVVFIDVNMNMWSVFSPYPPCFQNLVMHQLSPVRVSRQRMGREDVLIFQCTERLGFYLQTVICVCAYEHTYALLSSVHLPVFEFFTFESVVTIS